MYLLASFLHEIEYLNVKSHVTQGTARKLNTGLMCESSEYLNGLMHVLVVSLKTILRCSIS